MFCALGQLEPFGRIESVTATTVKWQFERQTPCSQTWPQQDKCEDRYMNRQKDIQTDRQTDGCTERQTARHIYGQTDFIRKHSRYLHEVRTMGRQVYSPQGGAQPPVPHKLPAGLINRAAAWKWSGDICCLTIEVRIAEHILMHHLNLFQIFRCQPSAVLTRFLKHDRAKCDHIVQKAGCWLGMPAKICCNGYRQPN